MERCEFGFGRTLWTWALSGAWFNRVFEKESDEQILEQIEKILEITFCTCYDDFLPGSGHLTGNNCGNSKISNMSSLKEILN